MFSHFYNSQYRTEEGTSCIRGQFCLDLLQPAQRGPMLCNRHKSPLADGVYKPLFTLSLKTLKLNYPTIIVSQEVTRIVLA